MFRATAGMPQGLLPGLGMSQDLIDRRLQQLLTAQRFIFCFHKLKSPRPNLPQRQRRNRLQAIPMQLMQLLRSAAHLRIDLLFQRVQPHPQPAQLGRWRRRLKAIQPMPNHPLLVRIQICVHPCLSVAEKCFASPGNVPRRCAPTCTWVFLCAPVNPAIR
jgi:hypothetical protein